MEMTTFLHNCAIFELSSGARRNSGYETLGKCHCLRQDVVDKEKSHRRARPQPMSATVHPMLPTIPKICRLLERSESERKPYRLVISA